MAEGQGGFVRISIKGLLDFGIWKPWCALVFCALLPTARAADFMLAGPAALPMQNYFQLLERARMAYVEQHAKDEAGVLNLPRLYTDELLQQAEEKTSGAAPCYRQRIQFVWIGLAWTRLVTENIRLMGQYWRKKDDALAAKVRTNWAAMERLCTEQPGAINWGPCRPDTERMLGLHPDHPNPKWKKKTINAMDDI
jgi:hypothetical protein